MPRLEVHAGEGGADATAFASDLAHAIARHANTTARLDGGKWTLHCL